MKLLHWFQRFNRYKITLFIASLFLFLGAMFPWYRLPVEALETFGTNLDFTSVFRGIAGLFAVLGLAFTFWSRPTCISRLPIWGALIAVLLFPYFVTTWSPTVAFLAAAYYDQGHRVSQHVETNFPQVQSQWEQNMALDQSIPITSIANFIIKDSRFFQFSSWDQILVEGLGYKNSFFGFIGRGWSFAVVGFALSLFALYLGLEDKFTSFLQDVSKFLPWAGLLIGIIVISLIWSNIVNHQIDTMFAKGEYRQVVDASKTLAFWYPPLSGDEAFLQRLASAGFYGNELAPGLLYFAKGLERYANGDFVKAEDYFQQSLDMQPHFLVRGYLATAVLNQGISYFNDPNDLNNSNAHRSGSAANCFERVLQIFPGHTEALYDLMLARTVNGEFEKSALAAQQIIEAKQYSQQPNLSLLGQAYLHSTWASYQNGNMTQAWKQYEQSIDNSTWKSGEVEK